jgi:hypothetical protein
MCATRLVWDGDGSGDLGFALAGMGPFKPNSLGFLARLNNSLRPLERKNQACDVSVCVRTLLGLVGFSHSKPGRHRFRPEKFGP